MLILTAYPAVIFLCSIYKRPKSWEAKNKKKTFSLAIILLFGSSIIIWGSFIEPKIIVVNNDFLKFHLPETSYKVFANIPFNLQTEIVNKLFVDPKKTPVDCYLIVEHKFAAKLMRRIDIYCRYLHHFHRTDFYPQPYTHTVLVHIRKQIV